MAGQRGACETWQCFTHHHSMTIFTPDLLSHCQNLTADSDRILSEGRDMLSLSLHCCRERQCTCEAHWLNRAESDAYSVSKQTFVAARPWHEDTHRFFSTLAAPREGWGD